ncbi:MAG: hypothetical protein U1E65_25830 [Myxococcota bacterium]
MISAFLSLLCLAEAPPVRGVALGLFSAEEDYDYGRPLKEIAALGATDVSLAVVYWQRELRSTEIHAVRGWTPSEAALRRAIRAARALGLRVSLFPILRIEKPKGKEWRGTIAPADEDAWWRSYGDLMLWLAALGEAEGVARFTVGSELLSREGQRERWLELIERVRLVAPHAALVYSANWDHYEEVRFWDAIDVVGITGYFEIARGNEASAAEMREAWRPIVGRLADFSRRLGRPLEISEIGYPSLDGGAAWPWDETRRAPVDLEEQRRAYQAFVEALGGQPWLGGIFAWNWFGDGGPRSTDYTPRNKPAARVLEAFYGGSPGR